MRHVLTLLDLTSDEIRRVLEIATDLKRLYCDGIRPPILERRVMGMIFEKPSLRTRVSFESLMRHVGGASLFLGEDVGWGTREPVQDFIPILTRYVDCLVIRAKSHEAVVQASQFSHCPMINGLTDFAHPCQALADMMTMMEERGGALDFNVAYIGYQFDEERLAMINQASADGRQWVSQTADPRKAVEGADFVYTDVWTSMGQEAEQEKRLAAFSGFQVTAELMGLAAPGARFLHCLPARRGEEVAAEVIDGPDSLVIDQAENRLHAQKGLVVWLIRESTSQQRLELEVHEA